MSDNDKNLYNLDELPDYKVAANYFDVRGWEVIDANSLAVGKVGHLLVNKKTERVVYLDVEVDDSLILDGHNTYHTEVSKGVHEFVNKDGENHLIIPIGMAIIDEINKRVITNKIIHSTFVKTKRFSKGDVIDFGYETNVLRHFMGDHTLNESSTSGDGFYDREEFNISRTWNI